MAQDTEDNFKKAKTAVAMAHQNSEEIVKDAKQQANGIIAQAVTESSALAESMRKKARADVETIIVQAKSAIESEKEQMRHELRRETAHLVVDTVEKVLGEGMTASIDKQLTSRLISDLQKS